MKKLLIAFGIISLLCNFLSVRDCVKQREAYKKLDAAMVKLKSDRDVAVAELNGQIDSLMFKVSQSEKQIDSNAVIIVDLQTKYDNSMVDVGRLKKKLADTNDTNDCRELVSGLELSLSLKCEAYDKLHEDFNLCIKASADKSEIIALKDKEIKTWQDYAFGLEGQIEVLKGVKESSWCVAVGLQGGVSSSGKGYIGVGFTAGKRLKVKLFGKGG